MKSWARLAVTEIPSTRRRSSLTKRCVLFASTMIAVIFCCRLIWPSNHPRQIS